MTIYSCRSTNIIMASSSMVVPEFQSKVSIRCANVMNLLADLCKLALFLGFILETAVDLTLCENKVKFLLQTHINTLE